MTTKRARREHAEPDAIELLKADHDDVEELFDRFEKGKDRLSTAEKKKLAGQICSMLTVHAQIEEEIFYPACEKQVEGAEDLLAEAKVEHQSAKDLIARIEEARGGTGEYDAQVIVLGEYIKHHVKEEESELFPKVRKSELDLDALGAELRDRKDSLLKGGAKGRKLETADG